ncbi:phosphotransferase [Marinicrinis lubricantis]|uniref:Phosphotransferase n=1 Tax=Marinicrinis lubricantis TaxID=2086470 RepID=A0ABW1IJB3_9BACL
METIITICNRTNIPIEDKINQLHACVQRIFQEPDVELISVNCEDVGYATPNFTTSGIYYLHGIANVRNHREPWTMILKIIKPDSTEKDHVQHHNYWRREALVLESGLLQKLPDSIHTAKCYLVEEQQDGTVWIWMELVEGEYPRTIEQFSFIARQLGRFNGAYLTGKNRLPDQEWICRSWLRSWVSASRMYAPHLDGFADQLNTDNEQRIWNWFQQWNRKVDSYIESLARLPRVLAHQDLSQMNMLLVKGERDMERLALIDWQFMSLSGIGEDLGKLFGVQMSLGIIAADQFEEYQDSLYSAYLQGLDEMGWKGDENNVRYGYCISTAARSVWEVPQYFAMSIKRKEEPQNMELKEKVRRLEQIIAVHMKMASKIDSFKLVN